MELDIQQFTDFNNTFYDDYALVTDNNFDSINNSIRNIIFTTKGEKVGDPEFGSNIKNVLFSQMDIITEHLLKSSLRDSLEFYEPRISVENIDIISSPDQNQYDIEVIYKIISSPDITGKFVGVIKRI